ncbi:bifunctional nuclease 1-like isoform X2 [Iris pallida]|uniref:Bifunctional nuclease 1-like isoform X2 n=1 Tax=Iris pallida TaxID=29817 RepID=A0AAX6FN63_IRIPA|nr:bifunctional nuclease 1-like isoform X2 [Iris pallida]
MDKESPSSSSSNSSSSSSSFLSHITLIPKSIQCYPQTLILDQSLSSRTLSMVVITVRKRSSDSGEHFPEYLDDRSSPSMTFFFHPIDFVKSW